jgi:hypothetical protein
MISYPPTIMLADGNPYAPKNVHPAHTPAKTAIMFYAAPTCPVWSGDEHFLSISAQHATKCILVLTFK